ncbi:Cysteine protease [Thalictrum thalictroides]|uniref:Cysteine protease n=1 Tax=Thalictrum thalictroides TaxID=46969 RepID=A0A7J6WK59_THATH|nr:Cysteine protease [Thalictrum thalictroides]
MDNNTHDLGIMKQLGLQTRIKPPPKVIECYWSLPPRGWLKVNTDGASKGNPGITGWGAVLRKDDGVLVGVSIGALSHQPLSVAIEASGRDFQFYSGGVFNGHCGTDLDHEVTAVGYGIMKNVDYIIVNNSCGAKWGEKGYIRMKSNTGKSERICGIGFLSH